MSQEFSRKLKIFCFFSRDIDIIKNFRIMLNIRVFPERSALTTYQSCALGGHINKKQEINMSDEKKLTKEEKKEKAKNLIAEIKDLELNADELEQVAGGSGKIGWGMPYQDPVESA